MWGGGSWGRVLQQLKSLTKCTEQGSALTSSVETSQMYDTVFFFCWYSAKKIAIFPENSRTACRWRDQLPLFCNTPGPRCCPLSIRRLINIRRLVAGEGLAYKYLAGFCYRYILCSTIVAYSTTLFIVSLAEKTKNRTKHKHKK